MSGRRQLLLAALAGLGLASIAVAAEPRVVRDVEYGRVGDISLRLDVGLPGGAGPFPVAILVHGGGWSGGTKAGTDRAGSSADITPWFAAFTDAGFVWFSVDYRLAPIHRWPAGFADVQAAIRWVKAHAAEYGGDPARVVIVGHSAGGHLACLAGVLGEGDTRVQAVVGFAPVSDLEMDAENRGGASTSLQALFGITTELTPETRAVLRAHSPAALVRPGLPPTLILQGGADRTVPPGMSRSYQARLRAAGNVCDVIELPGAPHGLVTWPQFLPDYPAQMAAWLHRHLPPVVR